MELAIIRINAKDEQVFRALSKINIDLSENII